MFSLRKHSHLPLLSLLCVAQDLRRDGIVDAMAAYVRMEFQEKHGISLDTRSWRRLHLVPGVDIPAQTDSFSCGVYAVVFAHCLAAGFPLASCGISAGTAQAARAHIVHDIMQVRAVGAAAAAATAWQLTYAVPGCSNATFSQRCYAMPHPAPAAKMKTIVMFSKTVSMVK
jgi:hypothetical protein